MQGFRKTVPDKWEFANNYFKRGHRELLPEIHRRKVAPPTPPSAAAATNSGDDPASTSTCSRDSKTPRSAGTLAMISQFADLTDENEKLKREKEHLSTELAQTKKQCDKIIAFLTRYLNVGPDQISRIMREGGGGHGADAAVGGGGEEGSKVKLFGVWLGDDGRNKKREWEEMAGLTGPDPEESGGFELQPHPPLKSSKVRN